MSKTTFYKKVGKRYKPVAEYDPELRDSFFEGSCLIVCRPGVKTFRYDVEPNHIALVAASIAAEDVMSSAIVEQAKGKPSKHPLTPEQRSAWAKLKESCDDDLIGIDYSCAADIARAGIDALIKEADINMDNPAVAEAFKNLVTVIKLTKEN